MRMREAFFLAGACVLLAAGLALADGEAVHFNVPLDNLGAQSEPGSGTAIVTLAEGTASIEMRGLQPVPHDNPLGSGRIMGYAAWLVNSENALGKLNMGFLFPDDDGVARLRFSASGSKKANLSAQNFNVVVITLETELDLARSQPSGVPIAAGHIPGTPAAVTPPPAVEVLMGKLTNDVFSFEPKTVTIFSGQTVRWTNVSPVFISSHTATRTEAIDGTAFGGDQEFNSGPVPFGSSFTHTFTLPPGVPAGLFNYHCTPHSVLGMTGRIVVVAPPVTFHVTLTGSQEVPPVTTSATASATITLVPSTGTVTCDVTATGLTGIAAHIHQAPAGVNGDIIVPLSGGPTHWSGQATLTPGQATALLSGGTYVNVHTKEHPGGEIRAQIK